MAAQAEVIGQGAGQSLTERGGGSLQVEGR